jgi:hypothetical protein
MPPFDVPLLLCCDTGTKEDYSALITAENGVICRAYYEIQMRRRLS